MKRKLVALIGVLGLPAVLGCTGYVRGPGSSEEGGPGVGSSNNTPDTPIATADAVALLTNPPSEPSAADIACTEQAVVPRGRIWRLSATGYKNSLAQVGYTSADAGKAPFDSVSENKFSTSSRLNVVSQPWADWYFAEGEKAGQQLAGSLPPEHACMVAAGASPSCVQGFVNDIAGKLFRRPVTADEVSRYRAAYTKMVAELGPQNATLSLVQAWTMSPNHVFRTELGDRKLGKVDLTPYELASELSFTFADSPPDAALLADAQAGKLGDPAIARGHAQRLLESPAGHEVLKSFFVDFLHLRELAGGGALEAAQQELIPSMQMETATFVENVVFTQKAGLDKLLTSTTSSIDQPLASLYGVSAGNNVDTKRPGLLHQAAFLNTRRDATRRGLFVAGELLCSPPAPPPPDAVAQASMLKFDENDTGREIQQVIQGAGPVCKGCHATFAPLGLGFEHYDAFGKFREQQDGKTLDVTGTFSDTGDLTGSFSDSADMVEKIVATNQGQLCFSKRFITYLAGRNAHGVLDGCLISKARAKMVENDFSLLALMLELTQDASFYKRINLEN
jgi:hypothetical protein